MTLFGSLSRHLAAGLLLELTLTTNGTLLATHAEALAASGVQARQRLARHARSVPLPRHHAPRHARRRHGQAARGPGGGLRVKLNTVALKGITEAEIHDLIALRAWQRHGPDPDQTMPLGDVGADRTDQYLPLTTLRRIIESRWTLIDTAERSGGPARYARIGETGGRIGFITPMSHSFCESCNRVRVSANGTLYTCLGQEDHADLRAAAPRLRGGRGAARRDRRRNPDEAARP